ncbi:MAG: DUF6152 family protein [Gammaproteobacteria bacterium]
MHLRHIAIAMGFMLCTPPVLGHHSDAGLDMDSVTPITGIVTQFNWRNPHVYISVQTTDENDQPVEWTAQMGSTIVVTRMGWTRESLAVGDEVSIGLHAALNGRPYGLLDSIEKAGYGALPTSFGRESAEPLLTNSAASATASSIEGVWMADVSELTSYPGGLDGFFVAQLDLTEKGQRARASYEEVSDLNPAASCIGFPTPVTIVTTNLYPLEIRINEAEETIIIRSEFFDSERIIYTDGRGHPEGGERTHEGHSIGWWEGNALVVDTRNFSDHRSPYQIGVPSGAQKYVVERYRLVSGGARMMLEFTLEDPEYIARSLTHSREMIYSPEMRLSSFDCDPVATRRFLPQ